jgi:hypothetical protein
MSDAKEKNSSPDWLYRLASSLAILEGLIVAGLGLFLILNSFFSDVEEPSAWLAEIAFAALGSIGLIVAGMGLKRGTCASGYREPHCLACCLLSLDKRSNGYCDTSWSNRFACFS